MISESSETTFSSISDLSSETFRYPWYSPPTFELLSSISSMFILFASVVDSASESSRLFWTILPSFWNDCSNTAYLYLSLAFSRSCSTLNCFNSLFWWRSVSFTLDSRLSIHETNSSGFDFFTKGKVISAWEALGVDCSCFEIESSLKISRFVLNGDGNMGAISEHISSKWWMGKGYVSRQNNGCEKQTRRRKQMGKRRK